MFDAFFDELMIPAPTFYIGLVTVAFVDFCPVLVSVEPPVHELLLVARYEFTVLSCGGAFGFVGGGNDVRV